MMQPVSTPQPARATRLLLGVAMAVIVLSAVGTPLAPSKSWVVFLDNLHWTVYTLVAATLAWLGVRQASGIVREVRRWFFVGMASYAFGQLVWDVQVYTGWNPFPAPADLFYLMLGPGCFAGLLVCLRGRLSPARQQALILDFVMFAVPVLALVLLLYQPRAHAITGLQLIAYTAYPVFFLLAACLGVMAVLHLRPRPDWPWLTFIVALVAGGVIWAIWNGQMMSGATEDGALLNHTFSLMDLALGVSMMYWRADPTDVPRHHRWYEILHRLLPLVAITLMSLAVAQAWLGAFSAPVRLALLGVALGVVVLAMLRQAVLLAESERLLEAEQAVRAGEERLRRLNRLYEAMLRSQEAIIRLADEKALMQEICRIVVELGGMNLAWVGIQGEGTQRVLPLAVFGEGADYLDQAYVTVDVSVPQGRGPTGTALREGRVVVNDSYRTNPALAPWRDRALQFGWGSSAAVPILRGGRPYAVLSVHHAEERAFDTAMMQLLQEMANSLGFALDKLDEARAREEDIARLRLAAQVFAEAQEGIIVTDASGVIIDVNPMFCEITGYERGEVIGQTPRILGSGRHPPEFFREMWAALAEHGRWRGEIWNRRKGGELYAELLSISALHDEAGNVRHYIGLFSDITHVKQQQEALELLAHYDPLTQLPNRVLFADRFKRAMARSKRENTLLALCYLDLDGFKQVNDTLGHEAGDHLLVEVAGRIKSNLREEDTVSRMGGDEFALLLGDIQSMDQCEQVIGRIRQAITEPYRIDGQTVTVGASIGVTLYPLDDADADTLLRHADQAMYQAKSEGRNRYYVFDIAHDHEMQSQRQLLDTIERAFSHNEFCLYYQPKVHMTTGRVIGAEALIRWRHPERGLVSPAEFLPVIEDTPFEIVLGNWVVEEAIRQVKAWRAMGLDLQVSVNISPRHLQWTYFFTQIEATLALYPDIPAGRLQLEVLESGVLVDLNAIGQALKTCRDGLGVSIALDDFGTGYSSLTHLRHLPADTVKIDQSFVRNMIDDPDDYTIVDGVVGLTEAFRRQAIAEGVETRDHGLMLLTMGCTHAQGYGVARPMPAEAIPAWVRDYRPDPKWIDFARNPPPPREAQILLLLIETSQWFKRMEASLEAPPGTAVRWPIMSAERCHLGRWLRHGGRDPEQFDPILVERIAIAHAELHELGNRLMQLYLEGKIEEARAGIEPLRALNAQVEGLLALLT